MRIDNLMYVVILPCYLLHKNRAKMAENVFAFLNSHRVREQKVDYLCCTLSHLFESRHYTPNKQSLNGVASRKLISMNVHACVLKLGYWHWYSKLYTQQNDTLVSLKDCYEETNPLRGRNLYSLNFEFIRSVIWELWPEIPAFCVPSTDQSFINFWSFGSDSMEI